MDHAGTLWDFLSAASCPHKLGKTLSCVSASLVKKGGSGASQKSRFWIISLPELKKSMKNIEKQ